MYVFYKYQKHTNKCTHLPIPTLTHVKYYTILRRMREKEYLKSVICNRNSDAYTLYMVASWACEVTVIHTQ